ncbi:hypothetical protein GCM10027174_17150 [Salinifilum aidingensis]
MGWFGKRLNPPRPPVEPVPDMGEASPPLPVAGDRVWVASKRESVFHLAIPDERASVHSSPGACGHQVRAVAYRKTAPVPEAAGGYRVCPNCVIAAEADVEPVAQPRVRVGHWLSQRGTWAGAEEPTAFLPGLRRSLDALQRRETAHRYPAHHHVVPESRSAYRGGAGTAQRGSCTFNIPD